MLRLWNYKTKTVTMTQKPICCIKTRGVWGGGKGETFIVSTWSDDDGLPNSLVYLPQAVGQCFMLNPEESKFERNFY